MHVSLRAALSLWFQAPHERFKRTLSCPALGVQGEVLRNPVVCLGMWLGGWEWKFGWGRTKVFSPDFEINMTNSLHLKA